VRRIKGRHAAHAASMSQICKPADRISLTRIPYTFIFIIPPHNNNITTNHVNHTFPEYHDWMKSKIAEKIIWGYSSPNLSHTDSASDRAERGNALVITT
jgi:hypothetical protein